MEELRSEIRAAFEKEQAAHPPIAALRWNVVDATTARPWRETNNYQWLVVAAAVVLGILVVVGLLSARFVHRASVPASPRAMSAPDYGPPPAGVPLLYLIDSKYPEWRIGYDWQGHPRGSLKFDSILLPAASPDGQFFVVESDAGAMTFFDRLGKPIPGPDDLPSGVMVARPARWADDSRHVCRTYIDQKTFEWTLSTQLPGEPAKPVSVITRDQNIGNPLQPISVASCSFGTNQAVLTRMPEGSGEVWVVRLSDGKEISHHYTPGTRGIPWGIVVSSDGAYMAENFSRSRQTEIRRVADWTVVATLAQGEVAATFSGNDSLLLVFSTSSGVQIVDWRSGVLIWRDTTIDLFNGALTERSGSAFAMAVFPRMSGGGPNVRIVRGDGTTTSIPGHDLTTGTCCGSATTW
jgi:hypothetical protein